MERQISQRELRDDSAEIMRALDEGDTFIVTRNGVPVGRLTPVAGRTFVPIGEVKAAFAHLPRIDYAELRAELDAVIDQDPTPRV